MCCAMYAYRVTFTPREIQLARRIRSKGGQYCALGCFLGFLSVTRQPIVTVPCAAATGSQPRFYPLAISLPLPNGPDNKREWATLFKRISLSCLV